MYITNKQIDGLIFVIALSALIYLVQSYNINHVTKRSLINYGDKNTGAITTEIISDNGSRGIYFVPQKTRIAKILSIANIDNSVILNKNIFKAPVSNGMSIIIGKDKIISIGSISAAKKIVLDIPININHATIDDFIQIPGIGEKQALNIIAYRNMIGKFNAIEDLILIPGIKERKFMKLKKYLSISDSK